MMKITILAVLVLLGAKLSAQVHKVTVVISDTVHLVMERAAFDPTGKEYEYYDGKYPFSINGRPIFGTDGDLPTYTLAKAILKIGNNTFDLQVDDMYDPWFGEQPNDKLFGIKKDGPEARLRCSFSDGAGSYGAEWLIVGHSSIRTILTNDEWIMVKYLNDKVQY